MKPELIKDMVEAVTLAAEKEVLISVLKKVDVMPDGKETTITIELKFKE